MAVARSAAAIDARRFGRRPVFTQEEPVSTSALGDDFRLFAITFAAGFLFVSILIG